MAIEITECQNGYARVGAVPDNSRCDPAGGGTCVDTEQVLADYLTANPDVVVSTPPLDVGGDPVALVGRDVDEGAAVDVLLPLDAASARIGLRTHLRLGHPDRRALGLRPGR